jgi:hypothetical protein
MVKFTPITSIVIQFSQPDLHWLASGDINLDPLFQTPDRDLVSPDRVGIMRCSTQDLLIAACLCTTNLTRIPMIVNTMTFSWLATNGSVRSIHTETHLLQALEHGLANNISDLVIFAHCDLLYYNHQFNGLNLDEAATTPFTPVAANSTPATASTTAAPSSIQVTPPTDIFNNQALPSNVLKRYDAHQDTDMTPFVGPTGIPENFYTNPFVIGPCVILQNGAVLEGIPDQKLFSKDPPVCTSNTPALLCSWYCSFTNHALSCGYFVVPYELLSKNNGSSNGFDFGTNLPTAKTPHYYHWQNEIGCVLKRSSTFPANSQSSKRATSTGNGYHILLAIVSNSHPAFVGQPILLTMHWPKQTYNQDIFNFYNNFTDNICLRSIFLGGA